MAQTQDPSWRIGAHLTPSEELFFHYATKREPPQSTNYARVLESQPNFHIQEAIDLVAAIAPRWVDAQLWQELKQLQDLIEQVKNEQIRDQQLRPSANGNNQAIRELERKHRAQRDQISPIGQVARSIFKDRAGIKLANIDRVFNVSNSDFSYTQQQDYRPLAYADLCGGPGAFVEYLQYRRPNSHGYGMTLAGDPMREWQLTEQESDPANFQIIVGADRTGNLITNGAEFVQMVRQQNSIPTVDQVAQLITDVHLDAGRTAINLANYGLDLVVADGWIEEQKPVTVTFGLAANATVNLFGAIAPTPVAIGNNLTVEYQGDQLLLGGGNDAVVLKAPREKTVAGMSWSQNILYITGHQLFHQQELINFDLVATELAIAVQLLGLGANLVCKVTDANQNRMAQLLFLVSLCFDRVTLFKPISSRPANAERYFIALNFDNSTPVAAAAIKILLQLQQLATAGVAPIDLITESTEFLVFANYLRQMNNLHVSSQLEYSKKNLALLQGKEISRPLLDVERIYTYWSLPGVYGVNYHPGLVDLRKRGTKSRGENSFPRRGENSGLLHSEPKVTNQLERARGNFRGRHSRARGNRY